MTKKERLSMLEAICNQVAEIGKPLLVPNLEPKKKVIVMANVAGAFLGMYDAYLKRKDGQIGQLVQDVLEEIKKKNNHGENI